MFLLRLYSRISVTVHTAITVLLRSRRRWWKFSAAARIDVLIVVQVESELWTRTANRPLSGWITINRKIVRLEIPILIARWHFRRGACNLTFTWTSNHSSAISQTRRTFKEIFLDVNIAALWKRRLRCETHGPFALQETYFIASCFLEKYVSRWRYSTAETTHYRFQNIVDTSPSRLLKLLIALKIVFLFHCNHNGLLDLWYTNFWIM